MTSLISEHDIQCHVPPFLMTLQTAIFSTEILDFLKQIIFACHLTLCFIEKEDLPFLIWTSTRVVDSTPNNLRRRNVTYSRSHLMPYGRVLKHPTVVNLIVFKV